MPQAVRRIIRIRSMRAVEEKEIQKKKLEEIEEVIEGVSNIDTGVAILMLVLRLCSQNFSRDREKGNS